jgi:penicillin-binding protein-related factor A (putative recombinase)
MTESQLQSDVLGYLRSRGHYVLNVHGGAFLSRGTPDILACINGQFYAFELKVNRNQLEPAQTIHARRIQSSGGKHFVIRSRKDLEEALRDVEHVQTLRSQ